LLGKKGYVVVVVVVHDTRNIGFPDKIKTIAEKLLKYEDPFIML